MKYNDFPTLSSEELKILEQQYNTFFTAKNNFPNELYLNLYQCFNMCNTAKNINPILTKKITYSKTVISQLLENLSANFNIKKVKQTDILSFNIFSFLNKLTQILHSLTIWLNTEKKIYYKTFIKNTSLSVLNILQNIILALEKSNVILFKHM